MGKGYSVDLRECVLHSLDEGMSKMVAHRTFHISRSTLDRWLALREQTGSVCPRAFGGGRTSSLRGAVFEEFVDRHTEATLEEMVQAWGHESGVFLSDMSFSRALRALGWTRKKRVGAIRSATQWHARSS